MTCGFSVLCFKKMQVAHVPITSMSLNCLRPFGAHFEWLARLKGGNYLSPKSHGNDDF
jgi:hypothetical protein